MTGFEIIILLVVVVVSAAAIGAYLTKGHPTLEEMTEQDDQEKVTQELYNKDLRPIVAKKEPARSLTESAQELIKEIDKVAKVPTTQEESKQLAKDLVEVVIKDKRTKSEFPIDKPKKKRKYYPKKK